MSKYLENLLSTFIFFFLLRAPLGWDSTTLTTSIAHYTQEYTVLHELISHLKKLSTINLTLLYCTRFMTNTYGTPSSPLYKKQNRMLSSVECNSKNLGDRRFTGSRCKHHLLSEIRKLVSLLEYQGTVQNKFPLAFLLTMQEVLTSNISLKTTAIQAPTDSLFPCPSSPNQNSQHSPTPIVTLPYLPKS